MVTPLRPGSAGFLTPTLVMDKPRKWTRKYKKSINCKRPRGFSQKQYCKYTRKVGVKARPGKPLQP